MSYLTLSASSPLYSLTSISYIGIASYFHFMPYSHNFHNAVIQVSIIISQMSTWDNGMLRLLTEHRDTKANMTLSEAVETGN